MTIVAEPADHPTLDQLEQSWPDDREERAHPNVLTSLFHSAVPVLKYLDWKVVHTERGFAETLLPLNIASTNQHITHQAAVMLIAADYAGGVALATLLHKVPLIGISPLKSDDGAYLWGAKADIRWLRPSTDDLVCTARIPQERHELIVRRFFQGRRVLETVKIEMKNGAVLVAEANITYWVQDTHALRRNAFDGDKVHPLYDHRLKTSALLPAGLRALEQERPESESLFYDPVAKVLAGNHGMLLAHRFCAAAPQIQPMVAARTRHIDDLVSTFHCGLPCQVVNIGVGLDSRMYRITLPQGSIWFDLDLPIMLRRRREMLATLPFVCNTRRFEVPIDLREHDLCAVLGATSAFMAAAPTLVIWEGGSMYVDKDNNQRIMSSVARLLENPRSRFWMDFVISSVIDSNCELTEVQCLMKELGSLGEPFLTGFADIGDDFKSFGLVVEETVSSDLYHGTHDPVFDVYRFCVWRAKRMLVTSRNGKRNDRGLWRQLTRCSNR